MLEEGNSFHSANRLRIVKKIAQGGMGSIFLAAQDGEEGFSKIVALKVINAEHTSNPHNLKLFIDEAKLVADLVHQSIVQVYNLSRWGDHYYIQMEYIHGKNLKEIMKRHAELNVRMPVEMCTFIISRVCRGLHYAHIKRDPTGRHLGIVHRDITPTNILVDVNGIVKITDFGIAKALTMGIPDERKVVMGKLPYMSPEQAMAVGTDFRSDIFSTGLVLYELLTGMKLFPVVERKELLEAIKKYAPKAPSAVNQRVPKELDPIVMRALELDPARRFTSAMDFFVELEKYMYSDKYGPTNEKLGVYFHRLFPEIDKNKII